MGQNALLVQPPHPFIRRRDPGPEPQAGNLTAGQSLALAGIAHDARNLVTALKLCAELLSEPGVFSGPHAHYAEQVRSIAAGSDHLVRRLSALARTSTLACNSPAGETPIRDLAVAVRELGGLLAAVAGPAVDLQIACLPCAGILRLSEENLTRILLNLVRNAADAMPAGGRIRMTAQAGGGQNFLWTLGASCDDACADFWDDPAESTAADPAAQEEREDRRGPQTVVLSVEDDGPGIPAHLAERIFDPGFSTRRAERPWPDAAHHGLGLSIVRQLVEEAGGSIRAVSPPHRGARFEIELPLTNVTLPLPSELPEETRNGGQ